MTRISLSETRKGVMEGARGSFEREVRTLRVEVILRERRGDDAGPERRANAAADTDGRA